MHLIHLGPFLLVLVSALPHGPYSEGTSVIVKRRSVLLYEIFLTVTLTSFPSETMLRCDPSGHHLIQANVKPPECFRKLNGDRFRKHGQTECYNSYNREAQRELGNDADGDCFGFKLTPAHD